MPQLLLLAEYSTTEGFLAAVEAELSNGGLLVRGARPEAHSGAACVVAVRLGGHTLAEVEGCIEAVGRIGVAVTFEDVPFELVAIADRLRAGEPLERVLAPPERVERTEPPRGTVSERLAQLTVPQKIKEALAGEREARLHLLRDQNKVLHAFVLKNPRVQLDEVLWAAKMPTLAADALQYIGEHKEWGQNLQIACALVRNPRTPTPLALRLMARLPVSEVRAIAKGGAKDQVVHAARKMLAG